MNKKEVSFLTVFISAMFLASGLCAMGAIFTMMGNVGSSDAERYADSQADLCQYQEHCDSAKAQAHADQVHAEHKSYVDREMGHAGLWGLAGVSAALTGLGLVFVLNLCDKIHKTEEPQPKAEGSGMVR